MEDAIYNLLKLYAEMDRKISGFQSSTGLHCPPGCGRCCLSLNVEATILEMIPVAREIHKRREAYQWLKRIEDTGEGFPCVFYLPDPMIHGNGRCIHYRLRPLLCRLFGFAAVKNKYGHPVFATCMHIKKNMPDQVKEVYVMILKGLKVPCFSDFSIRISGMGPSLGGRLLPINLALRIALEREGLRDLINDRQGVILKHKSVRSRPDFLMDKDDELVKNPQKCHCDEPKPRAKRGGKQSNLVFHILLYLLDCFVAALLAMTQ